MKKVIAIVVIIATLGILTTGCGVTKNGCPGATSQGRVPGKFKA